MCTSGALKSWIDSCPKIKVERLKKTQREYILSLGREADQPAYFEERLRIGIAHERVGLPQQWYLGAYALLFELIGWRLAVWHAAGQTKFFGTGKVYQYQFFSLLNTLQKVLTLDSTLAVETHYQATTQRLEHILHGSSETQQRRREASRREKADRALYRAKEAGRNQICISRDTEACY